MTSRFYALWAINGALEQGPLRRQMDCFRAAGLDGVVFHPRFYPGTPPYLGRSYFDEVSAAILYARSIGLAFWLYDENGWPSGAAGGQLPAQYPDLTQRWIGLYSHPANDLLAEFEYGGRRWFLAEHKGPGVDYLEPEMCRRFIEMTYEGYRGGLSREAFEYVETFFCDEPEFGLGHIHPTLPPDGAIPWTPRLPRLYRERHGEDLLPLLPALFFAFDGHEQARIRFHELLSDLFCEGFIGPLNDWCRAHGKRFTAHVKGEEHPLFQVAMAGSCHRVFRRLSLPGIDALERHPSNDFFARQVSSAARQFGDGRSMAEAFGGAGWGAAPEDLERFLLWLGGHGVTDFVLHLSQYRLDSAAIRDWPPSQPLHITWREVYPHLLARVRRELGAHPRPAADTLVIAPYRKIMGSYSPWELIRTNIHDAGTYPPSEAGRINDRFMELIAALHREGVAYDIADERTLQELGTPAGDGVKLGNCTYQRVIAGEGPILPPRRPTVISPAAIHGIATPRINWRLEAPPVNSLLLECTPEDGIWFHSQFACDAIDSLETRLLFADEVAKVFVNGTSLPPEALEDGTAAGVPPAMLRDTNILRFQTNQPVTRPFVWLEGGFRVASRTPFSAGPGDTVKTNGPFVVRAGSGSLGPDLIGDGFPFLREPLAAVADVDFPCASVTAMLEGAEACAIRLTVDGCDLGWTWTRRIDAALGAGFHRLRIEIIPNGYNFHGPHHYYNGDWPVVSPDQMRGARNFADAPGAPEATHIAAWHFRRFSLPAVISLAAQSGGG